MDLGAAAIAIGGGADPGLDPQVWLDELDRLAAGVTDRDGLVRRLFVEEGFTGNAAEYYDPDNSLLHRVLARRLGIPVSLAVVMIEVGRRAGVTLEGVGMPGHFLVREPGGGLLDPFAGGRRVDEATAEARFRAATGAGPDVAFGAHLLPAVSAHGILDRMLANLAAVYRARGAAGDREWALRMRLALPTADPSLAVELGEVLASRGRFLQGAVEIERHAGDDERLLTAARALRARLN
ncbi:MAG TPA: transglutaminase-like domain-containing protein [Egibacteraceae bacterium]|nr:transglutaminase-like domain-containing protein [Egibacteraceae bacterium]